MDKIWQEGDDWQILAEYLISTVRQAGKIQLEIYATDFEVSYKSDDSPVSRADIASEKIILDDLKKIAPNIPVLAEEAASAGHIPELGACFFCVDPLDGTKEFITKNDEFTVNIALVENGVPTFGLVYAPALGQLFVTLGQNKAMRGLMSVDDTDKPLADMELTPIKTRATPPPKGISVVASRSHMSTETKDYLKSFKVDTFKSAGSSLKLCMVASGEADLYPRLAPTMEWDTAAGHAIVRAAGGQVVTQDNLPLSYHKKDQDHPFLNPFFIARASFLANQSIKKRPDKVSILLLGNTDQALSTYVKNIRKDASELTNAPLVTIQNRPERLKQFAKAQSSLLVIVANQYDGLTRWIMQDIIMAAALGIRKIIIALYHLDEESDPAIRIEHMSGELRAFLESAEITPLPSCTIIDIAEKKNSQHIKSMFQDEKYRPKEEDVSIEPPNQTSDQFGVWLAWYDKNPMLPSRSYCFKLAGQKAIATITTLKYCLDPITGSEDAAKTVFPGTIAFCNISLNKPVGFEPFNNNRALGRFTLLDKNNNTELAQGHISFSLARATNLRWQPLEIDKAARAAQKGQKPFVLWFTGLSGCGKSTIASLLEKKLQDAQKHTYVLDGDNVRHGLCRDLGFVDADRVENMRRVSETAKLFVDAGLIVMVSFISPFQAERQMARALFPEGEFFEVFVDTPLEICEARDIKGLYKKARAGQVPNFTGISSPFEVSENPDIRLDGSTASAEEMTDILYNILQDKNFI